MPIARSFMLCASLLSLAALAAACAAPVEPSSDPVAEIQEPIGVTPAWTTVANPLLDHADGAAVLLNNGKVLVSNGRDEFAEVYDPAANTWTKGPMTVIWDPKKYLTATLLPSGNVVISTGFYPNFSPDTHVYNAASNSWTSASFLTTSPYFHTAALLNGKAVVVGGSASFDYSLDSLSVFDEPTLSWSTLGYLTVPRESHASALLANGKLLVVAGQSQSISTGLFTLLGSAEIFDPATNTSALTGSLATARYEHSATTLANGKVLVTGGTDGSATFASSELYDPSAGTWSATGSLSLARHHHTATLLQDGRVLVVGGATSQTGELYNPTTGAWSASTSMNTINTVYTTTRLADGRVLVVGKSGAGARAEIYDPRSQCVTFQRGTFGTVADTQLNAAATTTNYGSVIVANSGFVGGTQRQMLASFDLSPIPAGASVSSATLSLYEIQVAGAAAPVEVHRATSAWSESTVTWQSFAGAYAPAVDASFSNNGAGFSGTVSTSITSLVQGWTSGSVTNNGLVLVEPAVGTGTNYATSEATPASRRPALNVCFVAP